jgi:homoserine kinase type II
VLGDWGLMDDGSLSGQRFSALPNGTAVRFQARLVEHLRTWGYPALTGWESGLPYDPSNPAHLRAAGRALARYHQVVRGFTERFRTQPQPLLVAMERLGPATLAVFGEVAAAVLSPAESRDLSRALAHLWMQFVRVPETLAGVLPGLPQRVIHGSFGPSALVFAGDRVVGVMGWDRATYELRALDLAHSVEAFSRVEDLTSPHFRVGLDLGRCQTLMSAYGEVEDLAPGELEALPLIFRRRHLVRVLSETDEFLCRHEERPQEEKDVLEVVEVLEREADRLRWLDEHEQVLLLAMGGATVG